MEVRAEHPTRSKVEGSGATGRAHARPTLDNQEIRGPQTKGKQVTHVAVFSIFWWCLEPGWALSRKSALLAPSFCHLFGILFIRRLCSFCFCIVHLEYLIVPVYFTGCLAVFEHTIIKSLHCCGGG